MDLAVNNTREQGLLYGKEKWKKMMDWTFFNLIYIWCNFFGEIEDGIISFNQENNFYSCFDFGAT